MNTNDFSNISNHLFAFNLILAYARNSVFDASKFSTSLISINKDISYTFNNISYFTKKDPR